MSKITIGITLDFENDQKYSAFPYYALRENYIKSVENAGATPILLPFSPNNIDNYIELIDGLIITGGNFDISPEFYGEKSFHSETKLKENRTEFEWQICEKAIKKDIPILGICGGMQLLNVILGGDLIQHIPDEIENPISHEAKPYDKTAHDINIVENTILYKCSNNTENAVNSSHHQAAKNIGDKVIISATAPDGVIEAIESPEHKYILGVQWHPEYQITDMDKNIFKSFVDACK